MRHRITRLVKWGALCAAGLLSLQSLAAGAEELFPDENEVETEDDQSIGYSDDGLWMYNDYGDGTVSVSCQDSTITEAEVPSEINGRTITMIEVDCFIDNADLETVKLPSTITEIEDYAFYNCTGLKNISLPNGVKSIGWESFYNCSSLTEITIPASVELIDQFAFEGCTSLQAVNVSDANRYYKDEDGILFDYDGTTLILYPSEQEGTEYTVPEGCTRVEDYAFIGATKLESINIDGISELGEDAFYYCTSLQSISVPEGIELLDGSVFGNCTSLKSVTLPSTLTQIGASCFYNCVALESINIPDSLTTIDNYAFFNCASLTSLTLTANVTYLGDYCLGYYYSDDDELKRLPDFTVDTDNGTAAFTYAAEHSLKCTGGITQGIVFIYILVAIIALVIICTIVIILVQKHIHKRYYELK